MKPGNKNRTHLFLASYPASRGEITLALRVANDLHEQGDRIVFLVCESDSKIFAGKPFEIVFIDSMMPLDHHLPKLVQSYDADSLILVDLLSNSLWLLHLNDGKWFFEQQLVPVLALDIHDIAYQKLFADPFFDRKWDLSYLSSVPRGRILPVPLISPNQHDVYNSLPTSMEVTDQQRKGMRADLGISESQKFILMVSASWQSVSAWGDVNGKKSAIWLPNLLTYYASKVDPDVRVVHIGPQRFNLHKNLEGRYIYLDQVDQRRFQAILSAADMFLTANVIGTTLSSVLSSGIPTVVIHNSIRARLVEDAVAQIGSKPSNALIEWLNISMPVYPFHAWPLGYYNLISRLLINNPFSETFLQVELLQEQEVIEACRKMLFDNNARAAILQKQKSYSEMVRSLPLGADLINQQLTKI
jgi:hypothetical protein